MATNFHKPLPERPECGRKLAHWHLHAVPARVSGRSARAPAALVGEALDRHDGVCEQEESEGKESKGDF